MDFVELFLRLLEEVLELVPEKERIERFQIYSSKDGRVRIPVISTKNEIEAWLTSYDTKDHKLFRNILSNRLALIDSNTIQLTDGSGKQQDFSHQLVINAESVLVALEAFKEERFLFKIRINQRIFNEARLVAYICHELRHITQMRFSIQPGNFFSIFEKYPTFDSEIIPHKKLKRYWFLENKFQTKIHRNRYINNPIFIAMEKDAMYAEMLAFDCWIDVRLNYQEKILKLQEILWQKNKR
ncbi:MAG: hypothetical protein ACD_15C00175G0001 [uncultured bacterium]|nr:MAG: hypothetical protein ACD_15C00175G0001 [uncultured bacterium]